MSIRQPGIVFNTLTGCTKSRDSSCLSFLLFVCRSASRSILDLRQIPHVYYFYCMFVDQPAGPYWILDTDYETYSLVWSCSDFYFARTGIKHWLFNCFILNYSNTHTHVENHSHIQFQLNCIMLFTSGRSG
jgi:hypothetical protein